MVSKAFRIMNMRRFLLLTVLLLLIAACSNEEPLPPSGEPANLARLMVTGSGFFKVESTSLASLGWTSESPLTLTMNEEALAFQVHEGALDVDLGLNKPDKSTISMFSRAWSR